MYVVEQNRDAQMHDLIKLDLDPAQVTKLRRVGADAYASGHAR